MSSIRVALLGGVPRPLGGGGLERQVDLTADALRARGHQVTPVSRMNADDSFDLLHTIGNGPDVWMTLEHWRKHPSPLVVSPVVICSPGATEIKLRIGASMGFVVPNVNSMTRDVLRRADQIVALTAYERDFVRKLAGKKDVTIIDNGVKRVDLAAQNPASDSRPYVVMLGSVSERKGQAAVLRELGSRFHFVVAGGVEGGTAAVREWEKVVASSGAEWLGEIHDPSVVARLLTDASALVLFSRAEVQSLAVLEALAYGTPVVASALPSHKELAERWPGWVIPVRGISGAGSALTRLLESPPAGPPPDVLTWDDVAAKLETVYERALSKTTS
ncbi:MAG: glycosyltransferase family 4 protein [Thermoleophilaceae bacterium]|nr:glycosyltransferase family 4 protein [Thermoleophilaceae bacterium]